MKKEITVWVGVDWADQSHVYALKSENRDKIVIGSFEQEAVAIDDWVSWLKKLAAGGKIAIALEQSKGGLVFALMKYDFLVLYPINPSTVAKYREAWKLSGAKDDPSDAALLLELLNKHQSKFIPWAPEPQEIQLLQRLTEQRVRLMHDLKRVGNQLTSTLKEYFPEVLEIFPRIYRDIVADFVLAYPTLEAAQKASEPELLQFFRCHTAGNPKLSSKRIALLKAAKPLIHEQSVIASNALFVQALARELKALNASIVIYNEHIENVYRSIPDHELFDSLPCAGEVSGPKLLAAMGVNRSKFSSAEQLACFTGIAPVIERSGNQCWTHWRFKCNKHLRQAFIEWTFLSTRTSFWAGEFYKHQRAKGKTHSVAVRALAFKWIRVIFRMWKNKEPYSEARYLKALKTSGSPLIKNLAA